MRVFVTNFSAAVVCVTTVACGSAQAPAEPPAELLTMFNSRTVTHIGMIVHDANATAKEIADVFGVPMPAELEIQSPVAFAEGYEGDAAAHTLVANMHFDNITVEVSEPMGGVSPWSEWLADYGEGIHHLSFSVHGVDDHVRLLESKGGVRTLGVAGGDYALVDMMPQLGLVIELTEASGEPEQLYPHEPPASPAEPGLTAIGRIGVMAWEDTDPARALYEELWDVAEHVAPTTNPGPGVIQYPRDFLELGGDPDAANRETYIPMANIWVNLIQPVGGKSPWRDLFDRRPGGHYINLFVEDVQATVAYLEEKGGKRILGNEETGYAYVDMVEVGGLTVLLLTYPWPPV